MAQLRYFSIIKWLLVCVKTKPTTNGMAMKARRDLFKLMTGKWKNKDYTLVSCKK